MKPIEVNCFRRNSDGLAVRRAAMRAALFAVAAWWNCGLVASPVRADDRAIAAPLLTQLEDRRFSERQAAFLKLCDPKLDIDDWLDEQAKKGDSYRASLCMWLKRLRGVPGSLEVRMAMMGDFQSLRDGDLSVIFKYVDDRRIEALVDLMELLPESVRQGLILYRSADNPFDAMVAGAWRDGCEAAVPRLLNAILPKGQVRVGINARWRSIGMPESWRVDETIEVPEVEVAHLEAEGRIDEALVVAKRHGLLEQQEQILMRHGRWEAWLALDPMQMARGAAAWSDIQKAILLESLGRSEEADVYYALRKGSKAKGTSHQIQLAQLALITGDEAAWLEQLETHAKEEWVGVMFLRNELQRLLDSEGLSTLTLEEVDRWFDESTQSGKPLTKTIRFQSLFKRLGRKDLEAKVQQRIESYVAASDSEQRMRLWDGILGEWSRYGLEERRLDCLALLCQAMEGDKSGGDIRSSRRGPAKVGEPKTVTLDSLFFKAFPNFRSAAYPVYESLVAKLPDADPATRLSVVEDLHAGRLPSGWTGGELEMFFRDTIRRWISDPGQLEPMLVDMADALDVMGMTDSALELLQDFSESHAANLQIAVYVAKLGRIDEAAQLSLKLANRHPDDVNAYLLATQRLAEAKQWDDWLALQRRTLSQLNAWELVERYFQTARRSQRLEPQPEILFLLELLCEHQPSTWYEIWFGDAYTQYGSRILTDWYHRSIATHPERIGKLANLARRQCLNEIRSLGDSDVPNPGGVGVAARWEVDWPLWCMQYERCIAAGFWQAVQQGDKETAERLLHTARRLYPEQINTLIDACDLIRDQFGEDVLRQWFDIYYQPMKLHLEAFPTDTLTANNAAWLAAKCGFEIEAAWALANGVVAQNPTDTYLDTLAEVEFVRGNVARAIEISERCRSMQPRDAHHGRQVARFKLALKTTGK